MKNATDGLADRLDPSEERISELEDMSIESSKIEKHRFKIIHENCHCYHFLSLEFSPSNKMGFYIKDESESGRSGLGPYCETS